jgi:peptidyl-dipeptidase A
MQDLAPHRVVSSLEERLRDLETQFRIAYWESQTAATPENERRRADIELELRRVKGDPEALKAVEAALTEDLHESDLRRQLEVLRLSLTGNQMDEDRRAAIVALSSSIESDFAAHRPLIGDKRVSENEITEILKSSDDAGLRQRAWEASKEVGETVADRVLELVRLRNAAALDLGFADFYTMELELQEMNEGWLFSTLDELDSLTAGPFQALKQDLDERLRKRFGVTQVMPWHFADPFFQQLPPDGVVSLDRAFEGASAAELANSTFEQWGIDLSNTMESSDLYPREKKSQHAFCIDIDRSGEDIRILANVVPGERWVEVMLHESGHAAYDVSIGRDLPYFLHRAAHTLVTEGIALLSGRLVHDPRWLVDVAGLPGEQVRKVQDPLARATAAQIMIFVRWGLVVAHFERELYRDPEADLDTMWWELVERFQMVEPPPERSAPDWAAKVHIAAAPVYYQNYLLGEMFASQLRETCERECGGIVGEAAAGELLVERVFRPGALLRWDALIEATTGRPLSARDLASDLGA